MSWSFSRAMMEAYANSPSSPGLVVAYLQGSCSGIAPSVRLSETAMPLGYSFGGKTTASLRPSPCGTTFVPLTAFRGEELLTSFLAAFPVKPTARLRPAKTRQMTSGRKCGESWQMSLHGTYLPRTSASEPSMRRRTTSKRWVMRPDALPYRRQTWVLTTFGRDSGYLHTPTATANYCAPSMQKWPVCREYRRVFGRVTTTNHEWLMGWPMGWTDFAPLGMDKFRAWQQQHGECLTFGEAANV